MKALLGDSPELQELHAFWTPKKVLENQVHEKLYRQIDEMIGEGMNQKVHLQPLDRMLLHAYYKGFVMDADIFMDMGNIREYAYAPERVDAYLDRLQSQKDRVDFLIMNGGKSIGEIALKHIDETTRQCELSIHLQNDSVKNKGYGTQAERLIPEYAFQTLGMTAVIADSVLKNKRSQHTLEKVGFQETGRDETFVYYKVSQSDYKAKISIKKPIKLILKRSMICS